MNLNESSAPPVSRELRELRELDLEAIALFINFLRLIGLPKSIGEIYGLLFASPKPLATDDLMQRLKISAGAASQGLKLLKSLGAVKVVYQPGDRRDHYTADIELSKFATAFLKEELQPRMERAMERLQRMEKLLEELPPDEREATRERVVRLRHWIEKGQMLLPWAMRLLLN